MLLVLADKPICIAFIGTGPTKADRPFAIDYGKYMPPCIGNGSILNIMPDDNRAKSLQLGFSRLDRSSWMLLRDALRFLQAGSGAWRKKSPRVYGDFSIIN